MIRLQKYIKEYITKLFSDVHSAIVGIIVAALFLSIGSIYLFAKNLWTELLKTMQLPTPLWVATILVFVVLAYTYLKQKKRLQSSKSPDYKINYFTIGIFKWKTKIYKDGSFEVEKYPFCIKHDLRFIFGNHEKHCPAPNCNNRITEYDEFKIYESAKSIIEKKVRNKDY